MIKYILILMLVLIEIGLFLPVLQNNQLPTYLNTSLLGLVFIMANLFIFFLIMAKL
jgi:hypothetical protein